MVMGQSVAETEVVVIGAGPGGYVAAIRAAQLGFDVMLIDKAGELGGICLHHGCIPSKALIHATGLYEKARSSQELGIDGSLTLDFAKTQAWKKGVVDKLSGGIKGLCEKHGIRLVTASAKFENDKQLIVEGEGLDFNAVEFRHCIIATGSRPRQLPWAPFGDNVLSSHEALELSEVPKRFCVVGGGYIGIELGVMFAKAGSQVTVIEAGPRILGVVEPELGAVVKQRLSELGIDLRTETKLERLEQQDDGVHVHAGGQELVADKVLVAIGRVPNTEGLQLDLAGVTLDERGFITVDDRLRTSKSHIYAIGDVTGGVMLAHRASAQGKVAAEVIAEQPSAFDPQGIPAVVFSDPEIATVGLREEEAKKQYGDIKTGVFPFTALGKALAVHDTKGFVKVISDANGVIVGVHMVGPGVSDFISEASFALEMGATAEDLAQTIHPHPTLSESLSNAAEVLRGLSVDIFQQPK